MCVCVSRPSGALRDLTDAEAPNPGKDKLSETILVSRELGKVCSDPPLTNKPIHRAGVCVACSQDGQRRLRRPVAALLSGNFEPVGGGAEEPGTPRRSQCPQGASGRTLPSPNLGPWESC